MSIVVLLRDNARKHGVADEDIEHAWANANSLVGYENHGEDRLLVIGPDRYGAMPELVAVLTEEPTQVSLRL